VFFLLHANLTVKMVDPTAGKPGLENQISGGCPALSYTEPGLLF
jgi:hypothetical protein